MFSAWSQKVGLVRRDEEEGEEIKVKLGLIKIYQVKYIRNVVLAWLAGWLAGCE